MLLTKYVEMKWNSKNKSYYESKGYKYTKMKDSFLVDVKDLKNGSNVKVKVKCDFNAEGCSDISYVAWYKYISSKDKDGCTKDCCSNPKCIGAKLKENSIIKYGVASTLHLEDVKNKTKETNMKRYGAENPFGSKEIQEKIKATNLKKYGFEVPTQNPEIRAKVTATCIEKYGVENYGAIYSEEHKKELSPTWKGGAEYHRAERSTYEYRQWRKSVFDRDCYTCQCCRDKNGYGHRVDLVAHHIKNWKDNVDLRYEVDNGITLCDKCHMNFHSAYGKKNNTLEQLNEFLNLDKKVC